jgi:hypothetical protein
LRSGMQSLAAGQVILTGDDSGAKRQVRTEIHRLRKFALNRAEARHFGPSNLRA